MTRAINEKIREIIRGELCRDGQDRIKELEDCLEWLLQHGWNASRVMKALRNPKHGLRA